MWCDGSGMRQRIPSILVLAAAAFAALALTLASTLPPAPMHDPSWASDLLPRTDLAGALRVAPTSEPAAIARSAPSERMLSKASSRSRFLDPIGDLSGAPWAGATLAAVFAFLGVALGLGWRPAVASSDPRAPPLLLQHG